jgi:hypothetical protein
MEPVESDKSNFQFKGIQYDKIKTIISFVVPFKMTDDYLKLEYEDKYSIEFKRINNLFDDPIFLFLNDLNQYVDQNINGMPLTIFSDAVGNVNNSTLITVTIKEFYHPDFELINDRISYIDYQDKEAMLGRKYYPHKDRIVKLFRKLCDEKPTSKLPISITKENIDINFVSNYLVHYIGENNASIFHKVHTITNLDSYLKIKRRYLEKISELNLSDDFSDIRALMFNTDITSAKTLNDFLYKIIDIAVKKSIEMRGIYKFLWKADDFTSPLSEPQIQPLVKTHLQTFLEAKGVQITREGVAAEGRMDFLCTYTSEGRLNKVGIEIKLAHNDQLLHGLTKQLPEYLKDEGTKEGIFVVLWFKNDHYPYPRKYADIRHMEEELKENLPKDFRVKILVIDCTKKESPSKKKIKDRS